MSSCQCHGNFLFLSNFAPGSVDFQDIALTPSMIAISPSQTYLLVSMMAHYRATEIAVSTLSPVAIIVLILHSYSVLMTPFVYGLSLFSMIKSPKKFREFSHSSLDIVIADSSSTSIGFSASAITLYPSLVYKSKIESKSLGNDSGRESSCIFSGEPLTKTLSC